MAVACQRLTSSLKASSLAWWRISSSGSPCFLLCPLRPVPLRVRQEATTNFSTSVRCFQRESDRSSISSAPRKQHQNVRLSQGRVFQQGRSSDWHDRNEEAQHSPGGPAVELKHHQFFATCHPGLEDIVAAELRSPNIRAVSVETGRAGVYFSGDLATGLRANLWLRCATRVLVLLARATLDPDVPAGDSIYSFVKGAAPWHVFLSDPRLDQDQRPSKGRDKSSGHGGGRGRGRVNRSSKTSKNLEGSSRAVSFSVDSRVWDCPSLTNSQLASIRAKDAVCDAIRDAYGGVKPPKTEKETGPDLPLFLSVYCDQVTLYRDMSGRSLHKRGYRQVMHKASLNEAAAAAVLLRAGWHRVAEMAPSEGVEVTILDPMCGSGTLLIEAALMATNTAPGLLRQHWPFLTWHDVAEDEWRKCVEVARQQQQECPVGVRFLGCDIHEGALSLCSRDAEAAGVLGLLELECQDCREYVPPVAPSLVVVNPPWGSRLGGTSGEEEEWLTETWYRLGRFLKERCAESQVMVISGNPHVTQKLFLRATEKWPMSVGGIECRVLMYQMLPKKVLQLAHDQPVAAQAVDRL